MSPKKSGVKSGELVKQAHGGALRNGSEKGNTPGTGRPPSKIRELCRSDFAETAPVLKEIALDKDERATDRVKAIEALGKYGGVDKIALTIDEQPEREMTPERVADLFEKIQRIRTIRQLEKMLTESTK